MHKKNKFSTCIVGRMFFCPH